MFEGYASPAKAAEYTFLLDSGFRRNDKGAEIAEERGAAFVETPCQGHTVISDLIRILLTALSGNISAWCSWEKAGFFLFNADEYFTAMDIETVRNNMIEQQIRPWNVLELQTLKALSGVRREEFVPAGHRHLAFADVQIPLPHGEVMLEPKVSARLVEALALTPDDRVLEIGTGTGYVSALLASLAGEVTSVEIHADFCKRARLALGMAGYQNCSLLCADAVARSGEWVAVNGSFDAILVSGSAPNLQVLFGDLLGPQGRLAGIEGHAPAMQAVLYQQKDGKRRSLFETHAPRLFGIIEEPKFEF